MTLHRTKILNFLKTVPDATLTTIYIRTKIAFYIAREELRKLEEEGLITSRTNDNETYIYYKLKEKE